jgi:hypothetical protein
MGNSHCSGAEHFQRSVLQFTLKRDGTSFCHESPSDTLQFPSIHNYDYLIFISIKRGTRLV